MRAPRLRDDSGQMMTALIIGLCMTLLAFLVVALVPVGAATNEKTRSQTAADAAALAAADGIRKAWVEATDFDPAINRANFTPGRALGLTDVGGRGRDLADEYARLNDAPLEGYRDRMVDGWVWVEVENDYSSLEGTRYSDAGRSRSEAEAELRNEDSGVRADLVNCIWSMVGVPPTQYRELGGVPFFEAKLTCGGWSADYLVNNTVLYPVERRITSAREARDQLEPVLVE